MRCWPIVCLVVATSLPSAAWGEDAGKKPVVNSVKAHQACFTEDVRIAGFVVPRDERRVGLDIPGYRVTDILVLEGDRVTANQELMRATKMAGDDQGPQAAQMPATLSLRSPIAGVVSRIAVQAGSVTGVMPPAAPGMPPEPQFRIIGDAGSDLLVDIPSVYATQIRKGTPVTILRDDGREVASTVRVPISFINPATQLGQARIAVEHASALRPGRFASAIVETARDCGIAVPRSAVTSKAGVTSVQVLNGTSVETRGVKTGLSNKDDVQIVEGLAEGEQVVSAAGTAVKAGDQVTPFPQGDGSGGTP